MTPIADKIQKPSIAPSRAIRAARSTFPAPMFWPTSAETAIASPIAGIITTWRIVEPTPYAATTSVPNVAIRKVKTVRPSARADCSIDAGKPRKKARLMYVGSGMKSRQTR